MNPLPIDSQLPEIVAALRASGAVVVEAPPGAGKTTRVPRALLDAGVADAGRGEIVVVEPRRLPARLAAERVAAELGETAGQDRRVLGALRGPVRARRRASASSPRGSCCGACCPSRRCPASPWSCSTSSTSGTSPATWRWRWCARCAPVARPDLGSASCRPRWRRIRCARSSTTEARGACARVRSEGRAFEVAIEHLAEPDTRPLAQQVAAAVRRAIRDEPDGDLLVFLPGAGEIRRAAEALGESLAGDRFAVVALHGEMSLPDQNRAVRPDPGGRRKVILSTNVAETSVTIDGVVAVIDSGLARIASSSPWSGLPTLALAKISQSSAIQRAGRAGRTRAGRAYRLYTRHDFEHAAPPRPGRGRAHRPLRDAAGAGGVGRRRSGGVRLVRGAARGGAAGGGGAAGAAGRGREARERRACRPH